MSRYMLKLLFAVFLVGFGVFYGLDMANNGIERVNGPLEEKTETQITETAQPAEEIEPEEEKVPAPEPVPEEQLRPVVADKMIHRLADKTGEAIQFTVQGGVEMIVSLFEKAIH
jgi:hypothetical protein